MGHVFTVTVWSPWSPAPSLFLFLSLPLLFWSGYVSSTPLSPTRLFRKTVLEIFREKRDLNFSFSLCSSPSFLCVDLFLKEKGTPVMLSVSVCLFYFNSPLISFFICPLALALSHSFLLSFFLSLPSLRCQWASNWGSVIGREKRLGEK